MSKNVKFAIEVNFMRHHLAKVNFFYFNSIILIYYFRHCDVFFKLLPNRSNYRLSCT